MKRPMKSATRLKKLVPDGPQPLGVGRWPVRSCIRMLQREQRQRLLQRAVAASIQQKGPGAIACGAACGVRGAGTRCAHCVEASAHPLAHLHCALVQVISLPWPSSAACDATTRAAATSTNNASADRAAIALSFCCAV